MTTKPASIERRVAFDIGSAQIKMQVADVDRVNHRIVDVLLIDFAIVPLREGIMKSLDGSATDELQNKTVDAIAMLLKKAAVFFPKRCRAVATEGLRLAKNSESFLKRIEEETGLRTTIISQKEEGILGFLSAMNEVHIDFRRAVSWDFGGGSFQLTTKMDEDYCVYEGKLGKVPMKNVLLKIQGKDLMHAQSPNPISQAEVDEAVRFIEESLKNIPDAMRLKLQAPGVSVLSVGINPLWGLEQSTHVDKARLEKELKARLDLADEALAALDSVLTPYAAYRVTNMICVYGIMSALNIERTQYIGTQGANAVGLLLSPQYWESPLEVVFS